MVTIVCGNLAVVSKQLNDVPLSLLLCSGGFKIIKFIFDCYKALQLHAIMSNMIASLQNGKDKLYNHLSNLMWSYHYFYAGMLSL